MNAKEARRKVQAIITGEIRGAIHSAVAHGNYGTRTPEGSLSLWKKLEAEGYSVSNSYHGGWWITWGNVKEYR